MVFRCDCDSCWLLLIACGYMDLAAQCCFDRSFPTAEASGHRRGAGRISGTGDGYVRVGHGGIMSGIVGAPAAAGQIDLGPGVKVANLPCAIALLVSRNEARRDADGAVDPLECDPGGVGGDGDGGSSGDGALRAAEVAVAAGEQELSERDREARVWQKEGDWGRDGASKGARRRGERRGRAGQRARG